MVECTCLESKHTARYRGFESLPLRHENTMGFYPSFFHMVRTGGIRTGRVWEPGGFHCCRGELTRGRRPFRGTPPLARGGGREIPTLSAIAKSAQMGGFCVTEFYLLLQRCVYHGLEIGIRLRA